MRCLHFSVLVLLAALGWSSALNAAEQPGEQESGLVAKLHPWGRFEPGAWKVVHVTMEALDEQGQVIGTSVTDTQTTLVDVDREGVTLEIAACLDVVGKRFEPEPQTIKQGFHGEPLSPDTKVHGPESGQVEVESQAIPCQVRQIESSSPNGKTITTLYYSSTIAPYVLRRESVTTDSAGKRLETTMEVTTMEMPEEVFGEMKNCFHVKTVQKGPKGTVTTLAAISPDIPGGVIHQSSKEADKNGRTVRRSTLNLLAYSTSPDQDRSLFKNKRKEHRRSKTSSK